jgi:hypothetical protein
MITASRAQYRCLALVLLTGVVSPIGAAQAPTDLTPVRREMLCITEGEVSANARNQFSVNAAKMRAYVSGATVPEAEVRFKYLGATDRDVPLASGEMRRQFGLKLLAENACNLVYVMWRIEPEAKVVVSIKSNPGQQRSEQCGNRGYINMKPNRASTVPVLRTGAMHTLRARLRKQELQVFVDGSVIWVGSLGQEASYLQGPVGVRSDNARLEFMLWAHSSGNAVDAAACRIDTGE